MGLESIDFQFTHLSSIFALATLKQTSIPMLNISTTSKLQEQLTIASKELMLFELSWSGHQAGYILHLIQYWCNHNFSGSLNIVVAPEFVQQHVDVVEAALKCDQQNIRFISITLEESQALLPESSFKNRSIRSFQSLKLLGKYAAELGVKDCLVNYFDSLQLALAMGLKLPCAVSGIYFRPTFHYNHFAHHSSSLKDQIQQWRERIVLSRALSHPQFKVLFCLDPFVVSHIRKIHGGAQAVHLPDPVMSYVTSEEHLHHLRQKLGIEPDRQVFLLFGRLEGRKGIHQLLQAVSDLPDNLSKKLCLLLIGRIDTNDKLLIAPKLADLSQTSSAQIISVEEFVPDHQIPPYFELSDVVLAPYQRHVGMSAILIRAAAAQKPVLTSNYGLMGEVTRQHQLGLAIDATNPQEISQGLARFLLESPDKFYDRAKMQMFAAENSPERFAAVIFQNL